MAVHPFQLYIPIAKPQIVSAHFVTAKVNEFHIKAFLSDIESLSFGEMMSGEFVKKPIQMIKPV